MENSLLTNNKAFFCEYKYIGHRREEVSKGVAKKKKRYVGSFD